MNMSDNQQPVLLEDEEVSISMPEEDPIEISEEAKKVEKELEKLSLSDNGETIKTRTASKSVLLAVAFIALNLIVILLTVVFEFVGESQPINISLVWDTFMQNWVYGVIAILMLVLTIVFEAVKRFVFIKSTLKKNKPATSFVATLICKYYDNITPLGSGGQPFEVYYLRKKGIPVGIASGVPIVAYALGRIAYVFVAAVALLVHGFGNVTQFIKVLCIIGLAVNLAIPIAIFFFTVLPKFATSVANFVAKLGFKLHLVKDEEQFAHKISGSIKEYSDCLAYFTKKSRISMLIGFLCSVLYFVALYSIPFFVVKMSGNHTVDWLEMFTLCIICYTSVTLLPTPGNSGGAEFSFRSIFATFLEGGLLVWGMLSWRIISYYAYILFGSIVLIIQQILKFTQSGIKKERSAKKKTKKQSQLAKRPVPELYTPLTPTQAASLEADEVDETNAETVIQTEATIENDLPEGVPEPEYTLEGAETLVEFSAVIGDVSRAQISEAPLDGDGDDSSEMIITPANAIQQASELNRKAALSATAEEENTDNVIIPANSSSADVSAAGKPHENKAGTSDDE
ncbi:MAG: flippase-like domain-containing protein [Clostridia bacterium]|nr:flippase-like domain-containing protein [Clostridia bacterium]